MKSSTKVIIVAIVTPFFVSGGYATYVYLVEKPKNVKKGIALVKKRFEQEKSLGKFNLAQWELALKKLDPSSLKKVNKMLALLVETDNTKALSIEEKKKYEKYSSDVERSLFKSGFKELSENNKGLPFKT